VLSAGILVLLLEVGRRIGVRQLREEGESASKGLGACDIWAVGFDPRIFVFRSGMAEGV
jgi:hypothetical protein